MSLLVDNCVPWKTMRGILLPRESEHASRVGAGQLQNGELLAYAARLGFDGLVTVDQQMRYEQRLDSLPVPLLLLAFRDTRPAALISRDRAIRAAVAELDGFRFVVLDDRGVLQRHHPLEADR